MTSALTRTAALAFVLLGGVTCVCEVGCSSNQMIDLAMGSAPRPARRTAATTRIGPYQVLAGDLHCHVLPPDADWHVSRELPDTARLANDEGLDFVVLTPHVPARFFLDPEVREWVRGTQKVLRARVETLQASAANSSSGSGGSSNVLLIPGMEYTDHRFGHVGLAFADIDEVLDSLSADDMVSRPSLFFERWQAYGGLATINHPVLRALPKAPVWQLRYDLSWRGFPRADAAIGPDAFAAFPEIRWLSEHAESIETHNLSIGHLRDQYMVGDRDWTMREGTHLVDRISRAQARRITPVGGTDSHGNWLRPTTWVLATERTPTAIRDAIVAGRTCVRGPDGCSLEVRGADGAFHPVGASVTSHCPTPSDHHHRSGPLDRGPPDRGPPDRGPPDRGPPDRGPPDRAPPLQIEARVHGGGPATYFVNGAIAANGSDGELVEIPMTGHCSLVRVAVGQSYSAPVYVDCPWAAPRVLKTKN